MRPVIIIAIAFVLLIPVSSYAESPVEESEFVTQAKEEIPWQCDIPEPEIPPEWQGELGMNNQQIMDALREAQSQRMQEIQQCQNEYKLLIDQRVTELQCGDFEFGEYTAIEDYDLVYELFLQGLSEKNLDTSEVLVQYKGNVLYENECQSFYKEYQQLGKETERWNELCPDSGSNPNGKKHSYMLDIFNVCGFATLVSVERPIEESKIDCGYGTIEKDGKCVVDSSQKLQTKPSCSLDVKQRQ